MNWIIGLVLSLGLLLTGCNSTQPPISMDMPAMAGALRFIGMCGVICSLIWGAALVFSTRNKKE